MTKLAVIVVDHGSKLQESNRLFESFIEEFADESPYDIVESAHMELAQPDIASAFQQCVEQGADEIVVVPYFFMPGKHIQKDIPRLTEEARARHPHVSVRIAPPLGRHPLMKTILSDQVNSTRQP
ncbi:CbiX/SirB N-terminal domain-containing protein [Pseudobacteriovorax antillogorgiicola]|uniref:CbiX protein n=1 Tax=Pseudobacteriovorax antillogorgiicola TaxID=1513793 RepID=A0A1Y6CDS8_9BACT|nr:CbiX/SirB N-terminal domain-containing protein [Pseudobacteriovorax antillogorgiicola]TCS48013.1 CbiX protein [Pseudobacteriovorax antillogorgiicola]SMF58564.1 CbiX protein [Pseudobacteriovorax antillogorgiicola]